MCSGAAAALMTSTTGFIGFGNSAASLPTTASSTSSSSSFSSPSSPSNQSPNLDDSTNVLEDKEMELNLRALTKRDSITKLKALNELTNKFKQLNQANAAPAIRQWVRKEQTGVTSQTQHANTTR
jgi:hypothetical protein